MIQYVFAENLKRERQKRKVTQKELAKAVRVSQATIALWENCSTYPSLDKVYEIAGFFGIKVSKLLDNAEKSGSSKFF